MRKIWINGIIVNVLRNFLFFFFCKVSLYFILEEFRDSVIEKLNLNIFIKISFVKEFLIVYYFLKKSILFIAQYFLVIYKYVITN